MDAYLAGLEKALDAGQDLSRIHSVASFFVSRVDTEIDKRLEEIGTDEALALRGKAGVANARLAYRDYQKFFEGERWKKLAEAGANTQRPLWASTGVKNPDYSDTMYVSELVVSNVVNTMPEKTMEAFADHGKVDHAQQVMDDLRSVGIDYDDVIATLEQEGVDKFSKSWQELLDTVSEQMESAQK
jgi:transaldolase